MKVGISIITPFYNRLELLEETIISVINQSNENYELILVDDGSTDNNLKTIKLKYSNSSVKFITRGKDSKKGAPTCRNIGLKQAKYDLIMFLDSDDLLGHWCVEERLESIRNLAKHDLYIFNSLEFDESDSLHHRLRTIPADKEPLDLFLNFQSAWQTSSVIWSKIAINKINGWNETYDSWQDGEVHIRFLLSSKNFVYINSLPSVFIRKHLDKNRISNEFNLEKIRNLYHGYCKILTLLECDRSKQNLFQKNIIYFLFDIVEGLNQEHLKDFKSWCKKELSDKAYIKKLFFYIDLYRLGNYMKINKRFLYQFRKIGLPIKRKLFWNIRPKLNDQDLQKLSIKLNEKEGELKLPLFNVIKNTL